MVSFQNKKMLLPGRDARKNPCHTSECGGRNTPFHSKCSRSDENLARGAISFNIRPFSKTSPLTLLKSILFDILARIEDLTLRAWAIGARWQLKTQVLFFLFSYTPYLSQEYNTSAAPSKSSMVVVPYYLSQGYNRVAWLKYSLGNCITIKHLCYF